MLSRRFLIAAARMLALALPFTSLAAQLAPQPLPGDDARLPSAAAESHVAIARGGPGYLAVWTDRRTSIASAINTTQPLTGNKEDIYGMRLGLDGQPLDAAPIVICNSGQNQSRPQLAWNGSAWLVVFTSQRPDWYFFEDIVGVRVAGDGSVLDATPISIRPELNSPANYQGMNPTVAALGGQWYVAWEDWVPANSHQVLKGSRVAADGSVLDPGWPVIYDSGVTVFGPTDPQLVAVNGELLLAWREQVFNRLRARRVAATLAPIGAAFLVANTPTPFKPSLASDGAQSYLLCDARLFRIAGSSVLDPAGILLPPAGEGLAQPPKIAWNGSSLSIVRAGTPSPQFDVDADIYLQRVAANGSFVDAQPVVVAQDPDQELDPAAAGESGRTQVVHLASGVFVEHLEDVRGVNVDGALAAATVGVSDGQAEQEHVRSIAAPFGHLLSFGSRTAVATRALAQRVDATGHALDAEPLQLATTASTNHIVTSADWNGSSFCIAWSDGQGPVFAQRFSLELQPLDAPQAVFATGGAVGVGALSGGDFLITSTRVFSGDQSAIQARRMTAGGSLPAPAFDVSGSFAFDPHVVQLGGRWLVSWSSKPTHDSPATFIRARFVEADGSMPSVAMLVSTIFYGTEHDVAVKGDRALLVWQDYGTPTDAIEGRLLSAAGSFLGPDFTIVDAAGDQMFPTVTTTAEGFTTVWVDYRTIEGVEQLRGDLWAARLTTEGAVLDPTGVQLTAGELPEDLPDASSAGFTQVFFDALGLGGPLDVPRLHGLRVDEFFGGPWSEAGPGLPGFWGVPALSGSGALTPGSSGALALHGARPGAATLLAVSPGGSALPFKGGTLSAWPIALLVGLATDAQGTIALPFTWPAGLPSGTSLVLQALVQDGAAVHGVTLSSALGAVTP
jgi:hypothetical protein